MTDREVSPLPREARPFQGRRAGLVTRMVAAGLDAVVVAIFLLGGYVAVVVVLFLVDPRGFAFPDVGVLFSLAAGFVVLVGYQTLAWWLVGHTYGALVMGLRVVDRRGRGLRLVVAFLRALFNAALPIGILWIAVSRENRSLQDVALRTSVIYDWQPRGQGPGGPG